MSDCLNNENVLDSQLSQTNVDSLNSDLGVDCQVQSDVGVVNELLSKVATQNQTKSTLEQEDDFNSKLDLPTTNRYYGKDSETILVKVDNENYTISADLQRTKYNSVNDFPIPGSEKLLYVDSSKNAIYTWDSETQSYVKVVSDVVIPEKLSEFINDGDGNSPFATEEYVKDHAITTLTDPVYISQLNDGIYRLPLQTRIYYGGLSALQIEQGGYLFVTKSSNERKDFYMLHSGKNLGQARAEKYLTVGHTFVNNGAFGSYQTFIINNDYVDVENEQSIVGLKTFETAPKISAELSEYLDDETIVNANWISNKLKSKQDKLVAGENITIDGNIISATGGGSGGGSIPTLESPVRIWNLNSGIYLVPKDATIYYNGATSENTISYKNDTPSVLIVKYHLNEEGTADFENKRYMLFSYSNEAQSYLGFIQGSTTETAGSYSTDYCFTRTYKDAVDGIIQNGYVDTKTAQTIKGVKTFEDDIIGTISNAYNDGDGNSISGTYLKKTENAVSATKATQDGEGNVIADTYLKKDENAISSTKASQDGDGNIIANTYLKKSGGTLTGAINLNSGFPQIKTNQADFVIQTAGGQQYDFTNTEFRPTSSYVNTLSIGKSDRKFKDGYFSGSLYCATPSTDDNSTKVATTEFVTTALLNKVYPVGSVYISTTNVSPASFLGGSWTALPEGYALWTTTTSGQGGQTISAGLPNITGSLSARILCGSGQSGSGALISSDYTTKIWQSTGSNPAAKLAFDASSSNSIYGASTTVQPPAYKVYAWKRIS